MTKILFGIMSAVSRVETVAQLTQALSPHRVVIHHDYSQQPRFDIDQPHVRFVEKPLKTGYGSWIFPRGILHLIRYCVDNFDFDYFQLLSPSCLPIRPLPEFERYISLGRYDAHAEFMDVREPDVMMHYGCRAFAPARSVRRYALRQLRRLYFGAHPSVRTRAGLGLFTPPRDANGALPFSARIALKLSELASHPPFALQPPPATPRIYFGGTWFGGNRKVCEHIVTLAKDDANLLYFQRSNDICEQIFATILGNSTFSIGPFNGYVSPYGDYGWHPRPLDSSDFEKLVTSRNFFARKFPDDPSAEIRRLVLRHIETKPETNLIRPRIQPAQARHSFA